MVEVLGAGVFMALALERVVELLLKPRLPERFTGVIPYVASGLGLLAAFGFAIALVPPTLAQFSVTPAVPWAGTLLTGLLLGGGSNFLHDIWPGK